MARFVFEVFYKDMLTRNEHLVSAINNPEITAKLSEKTLQRAKNFIAMYSAYIRKVRIYDDRPIYTGSVSTDVFKGGIDKVTGLPALKSYLMQIEQAMLAETK